MGCRLQISSELFFWLLLIFLRSFSQGYTYESDVSAINNLYISLGSPRLPGWASLGGDPCGDKWQGVQCEKSNITEIRLNGANLGGELGDKLAIFSSLTVIFSNNHIGGSIPEGLPISLQQLYYLSDNQFQGSIPGSLSELTNLTALSLNNNILTGELPDSFQLLTTLTNVDLSYNNLSGKLPSSMHIQNNQLSGTLDVLQDLPLKDLNIEGNFFSGPVPAKLLNIPIFKMDGNPFNTSVIPSGAPPPLFSGAPSAGEGFGISGNSSSGANIQDNSLPSKKRTKKSSTKIVLTVFGVVLGLIFLLIIFLLIHCCLSKLREKDPDEEKVSRREDTGSYDSSRIDIKSNRNLLPPTDAVLNDMTKETVPEQDVEKNEEQGIEKTEDHIIDSMGVVLLPPPPVDKVIVNPIVPPVIEEMTRSLGNSIVKPQSNPSTSALSFSVASLQQYTNSFSEENLIRDGRLGKFYQADLDDGKQLMVMKLDNANLKLDVDHFFDTVLSISELRHPNIVELIGFCAEYDQRLLVYNFFGRMTLHDILHGGDSTRRKLSWFTRIRIALDAAKALQYLHEDCEPPVVHQNFESASILLDDELTVRVCDCGFASMGSAFSVSQLSGRVYSVFSYEAPEVSDSGAYTHRSDVYSFGVIMLELLTGRKPYDSSRPRAEQYLVRWVISQLHDIDNLSKLVDPAIQGKFPVKSLSRFADIISRCIQDGLVRSFQTTHYGDIDSMLSPEFRPQMSEVTQDLACILEEVNQETK